MDKIFEDGVIKPGIEMIAFLILAILSICAIESFGATVDMEKIKMIESSGCKQIYGKYEHARGCYQVTAPVVDEYNQYNGTSYTLDDNIDEDVNFKIASWYLEKRIPQMLKYFKKPETERNILIAYNCGIKCVVDARIPPITESYLRKYFK